MSAPGAGTMLTLRLPRPAAPDNWTEPAEQAGLPAQRDPRDPLSANATGQ
jgi:hypothetical protein